MKKYSTKELSKLAGVSVRTLHHYDDIGLLRPAFRTESNYRLYGVNEVLLLQQIIFYKELEFSLKEIKEIITNPEFDLINALIYQKEFLKSKRNSLSNLLESIDNTITNLKGKKMITENELYDFFPKEEQENIRKEAIQKYGNNAIQKSEHYLKKLSKEEFEELKKEQKEVFTILFNNSSNNPESELVQLEIARHYKNIRKFWGTDSSKDPQWREYKGLGELYINDERFTHIEGKAQPGFAEFLSKAMTYFVETQLK